MMEKDLFTQAAADFNVSQSQEHKLRDLIGISNGYAGMVLGELTADGMGEADAMMAVANIYLLMAAHTACSAARLIPREPDIGKWRAVSDVHFQKAIAKIEAIDRAMSAVI